MTEYRFIVYRLTEDERSYIENKGNEEISETLKSNTTYVIVDKKNKILITLLGSNATLKMKFFASMFTVELHRKEYNTYQTTTFDTIDEFKKYINESQGIMFTEEELKKFERKIKPRFFKNGGI